MKAGGLDTLTVLGAALFMLWPAVLNHYPIVYSDTGGFLMQALMPDMGWDKPWIYGPFLTPFHWRITLWPAAAAQAVILSAFIWLTQAVLRPPSRLAHLAIAALLAAGTAAPWFVSTLMPDIFAPITVLGVFLLSSGRLSRPALVLVGVLTTIAIAVHLAHLVLAAACLALLSLLQWRVLWRQTGPLLAALALIVMTNVVGHGVVAVSPYGSVFALARLVATGPARDTIQRNCPQAGWHLCQFKDHLPADSDDFLWDPYGPVWGNSYGPTRLAPEASIIVRQTILSEPVAVLRGVLSDTLTQLGEVSLGDTLSAIHLDAAVLPRLQAYFPAAEVARFQAGLQARDRLPPVADRLNGPDFVLLFLGTAATLATAVLCWRRRRPVADLAILCLGALLANAASTGALSHPHDRYQARIAWLVVLVPALAVSQLNRPAGPLPPRRGAA